MLKNLMKLSCAVLLISAAAAHASVQANSAGWEKYGELTLRVAERTGVPVMELTALTSIESGYRAGVCNREGSSACGLGAMTQRTFNVTVKRYGRTYGVKPGSSRRNAEANLLMTAAYWNENKRVLSEELGRPVTSSEAYMAHLLGPSAALKVIKAPGNRAAWKVAGANPNKNKKFFMKGSRKTGYTARTVSEFRSYVAAEMKRHATAYRGHIELTAFQYQYHLPNA